MSATPDAELRLELIERKEELSARLVRIKANVTRGFDANSKEMAKQLEDAEVVDALGNEAREEIAKISAALARMDSGHFGICIGCAGSIDAERRKAYPSASECIDCARASERSGAVN